MLSQNVAISGDPSKKPRNCRSEDLRTFAMFACTSRSAVNWPAKERPKVCAASTTARPRRIAGKLALRRRCARTKLALHAVHRERRDLPVRGLPAQTATALRFSPPCPYLSLTPVLLFCLPSSRYLSLPPSLTPF